MTSSDAHPFTRGSWQHAIDDALVMFGKTSLEFTTPHAAVEWLLQQQGEMSAALAPGMQMCSFCKLPQDHPCSTNAQAHECHAQSIAGVQRTPDA